MTYGEERTISLLSKLVSSGDLPHALLLSGGDTEYKKKVANSCAGFLLHGGEKENFSDFLKKSCACKSCEYVSYGTHPDFARLADSPVSIGKIRDLKSSFALAPYLGGRKIAVIENAETFNREAANAFLKLLEEPRGDAVFILLAPARSSLFSTIYSRVVEIRFPARSVGVTEVEIPKEYDEHLKVFEGNSLYRKLLKARNYTLQNKEDVGKMLDFWLLKLRHDMIQEEMSERRGPREAGATRIDLIKRIFAVKVRLHTTNMNPALLMEELSVSSLR